MQITRDGEFKWDKDSNLVISGWSVTHSDPGMSILKALKKIVYYYRCSDADRVRIYNALDKGRYSVTDFSLQYVPAVD